MGYKTVTFTNEIEQKTYVQGEFVGKYFGALNPHKSSFNFEFYDIQIYKGEISNLKNEKEHQKIINETVYNAIVSETQLIQKSFENILVNLDQTLEDYDSFRLAIKGPKLESVQIYDVLKDGNKTFGTLSCIVSGYLSKVSIEINEIEVEICDQCGEFIEDCHCRESDIVSSEIEKSQIYWEPVEETFWSKPFNYGINKFKNWNWGSFDHSSFGCLGLFGLLLGLLILFSFGLPGILIGILILTIYVISSLTRVFPELSRSWRRSLYIFLGLLLLGLSFYFVERNILRKDEKIDSQTKTQNPKTQEGETIVNYPKEISNDQDQEIKPYVQQDIFLETDNSITSSKKSVEHQSIETIEPFKVNSKLSPDSLNYLLLQSRIPQAVELNKSQGLDQKNQTKERISTSEVIKESQTQRLKKLRKTPEIMTGIIFHEGEIFICKGGSSKRYHFNPNCPGLSNCSTRIYQINIPAAERMGRTLCRIEE